MIYRTRQASITTELIEIISGASALDHFWSICFGGLDECNYRLRFPLTVMKISWQCRLCLAFLLSIPSESPGLLHNNIPDNLFWEHQIAFFSFRGFWMGLLKILKCHVNCWGLTRNNKCSCGCTKCWRCWLCNVFIFERRYCIIHAFNSAERHVFAVFVFWVDLLVASVYAVFVKT